MNVYEKLMNIQAELKAPKSQFNKFGNYAYRSCEDILESLKPLLNKNKAIVLLSDEIVLIGERYYLQATATFVDIEKGEKIEVKSLAREDENKKGMDLAQITGSVSSYARKYALNGLFAIDDTKDSDVTNTHDKDKKAAQGDKQQTQTSQSQAKTLSDAQLKRLFTIASKAGIKADTVKDQVKKKFNKDVKELTKLEYDKVCSGYEWLNKTA